MSVFAVTNRRDRTPAIPAAGRQDTVGPRTRRALVLSGWLALILGQALGLLMANPRLFENRLPFPLDPGVVTLVWTGLAGLLTGIVAGLALRGASALLRWSVAVFGVLVGLIVFEISLGLLHGQTLRTALIGEDDALKIGQTGLGILGASLGVLAGRASKPRVATTGAAAQPAARRRAAARPTTHHGAHPSSRSQAASSSAAPRRGRTGRTDHGRASAARSAGSRGSAASVSVSSIKTGVKAKSTDKPAKRRKRLGFMRSEVHLGKEQTAVCPYCLEEVKPNDPRGKVVCRICGTPHHADCWAITGKCEVPHLQT